MTPGVNLIIEDVHEIEGNGRDQFVTDDVVISVICKPKLTHPSTATNWANNMYPDRLQFRKEHEVQGTGSDVLEGDDIEHKGRL